MREGMRVGEPGDNGMGIIKSVYECVTATT